MAAATLTGIPGIIPAMAAAGDSRAGATGLAPGMIILRIPARACAWAAGRAGPGSVTSTVTSIVMARVVRVTVVAVRDMGSGHRLLTRMYRTNTSPTRVVARVMVAAVRAMHHLRRLMSRVARMNIGATRAVVPVMAVADRVPEVLHRTTARAGASEAG